MSHTFHHYVRSTASAHFLNLGYRIIIQINHLRTQLLRLFQSLRHTINRNNVIHHRQCACNGADSHGSAPDTHNSIFFSVSVGKVFEEPGGGEVARGEDGGHEDEHFLRYTLRRLHERRIGEWTPHILCLASGNGIRRRTVSKQLAFAAARCLPANTVIAFPARSVERYDDLVADFEVLDIVSLFDDLADELVAADEVGRAFEVAAIEVEVGAAEGSAGDFENGVGGFLDLRDGPIFDDDLEALISSRDNVKLEGSAGHCSRL